MAKTSVAPKKKRGPAPTGKGVQVGERWHPSELAAIDAWIAASSDKTLTRAHAIRRLVALGLKAKGKWSSTHNEGDMISVLIGVLIIVVVGAICFWAIDKFATDSRLANLLKLLVVLVCLGAILQRVLPLTY
jgi:hypothetical protein